MSFYQVPSQYRIIFDRSSPWHFMWCFGNIDLIFYRGCLRPRYFIWSFSQYCFLFIFLTLNDCVILYDILTEFNSI